MTDWRRRVNSQALALEFPQIIPQIEAVWEEGVGTVFETKSEEEAGGWNK